MARLTCSNYEQLGLDFRLYSAEVLFNCGLTKIYLGQTAAGMQDLREASTQKQVGEHAVIDDAVRDLGKDYNVFSVPVGNPCTTLSSRLMTGGSTIQAVSCQIEEPSSKGLHGKSSVYRLLNTQLMLGPRRCIRCQ